VRDAIRNRPLPLRAGKRQEVLDVRSGHDHRPKNNHETGPAIETGLVLVSDRRRCRQRLDLLELALHGLVAGTAGRGPGRLAFALALAPALPLAFGA
jgi:hypothetical protein